MTDNEIIQAWDLCLSGKVSACNKCPYCTAGCIDDLHFESASLIKRQQAEIERLQDRLDEKQATSDNTSEWISVKDRLPENGHGIFWKERKYYLVHLKNGQMLVAKYGYKEHDWWIDSHDCVVEKNRYREVTHWRPMPEPPKGD